VRGISVDRRWPAAIRTAAGAALCTGVADHLTSPPDSLGDPGHLIATMQVLSSPVRGACLECRSAMYACEDASHLGVGTVMGASSCINIRINIRGCLITAMSASSREECAWHRGRSSGSWHHRGDEQVKFPSFSCDRHPASGCALPDLRPHCRIPARQDQRGSDRALPPGPSRNARPFVPIAEPRTVRGCDAAPPVLAALPQGWASVDQR
jgi:hypothetical protein